MSATALDKAIALHKQGRLDMAEAEYHNALTEDLDNANILYLLGTLYLSKKAMGIAAQLLLRACQMKNDYYEAWNNLGNVYKAVNREVDAKICWERCLNIKGRSNDDYADIWNNIGTLYVNAGDPATGVEFQKKAIELSPLHPDAHWNMGLLMLEQGFFKEGFELYKWGFKSNNRMYRFYGDNVNEWNGEHGKNIVIWGEQGIGDEILFASIIPDLVKVSNKVVFDCHPRLEKLFKESFPELPIYGTRKDEKISWMCEQKDLNAKSAIADIAQYFRQKLEDFPGTPYLKASDDRREHYRKKLKKLGDRPKIGISWTGGYLKTRRDYRSIPLEKWGPIFDNDVDFISLQYTSEAYNTVSDIEDKYDVKIHHWPSAVQNADYHETAALVSELDLVITVNTAAHHLTGALGKECWTLTPFGKAWRYYSPDEHQKTIPWYKSVRQWQQKEQGQWEGLIEAVGKALRRKF